jgi:organic hydroperoxide reductase OsmC/OhrA
MSEHKAKIIWKRTTKDFGYETYNRDHRLEFEGGQSLRASAAPEYHGAADCVDPEEALVAAAASCHMLTFLALAARKKIVVDSYTDDPVGTLEQNTDGKMAVTKIALHPRITFASGTILSDEEIHTLHTKTHQHCFIANSISSKITVNGRDA